jgi:hypothetical protein
VATFVPTGACYSYNITCVTGAIRDLVLAAPNYGGLGYPVSSSSIVVYANGVPCGFATSDAFGQIISFTITVPGLYTVQPIITLDPPPFYPGVDANVVAIVRCQALSTLGTDCSGQPDPQVPIAPGLLLGQSFNNCYNTVSNPLPVLPTSYTMTAGACCTDCVSISISNNANFGSPQTVTYRYTTCNPKAVVTGVLTASQAIFPAVCVINGSWLLIESDPANAVGSVCVGGPC